MARGHQSFASLSPEEHLACRCHTASEGGPFWWRGAGLCFDPKICCRSVFQLSHLGPPLVPTTGDTERGKGSAKPGKV